MCLWCGYFETLANGQATENKPLKQHTNTFIGKYIDNVNFGIDDDQSVMLLPAVHLSIYLMKYFNRGGFMIITKNANVLITSFILMSRLSLYLSFYLSLASRSTNPCSILIRLRLSIEYEIIAPDFRMKFMKNGIDNE